MRSSAARSANSATPDPRRGVRPCHDSRVDLDDEVRWRAPTLRTTRGHYCAECRAHSPNARPPCDVCGVERCARCPAACAGCERLEAIRALLRGEGHATHAISEGAEKTFRFVLDLGPDRDVRIRPRAIAIRNRDRAHAHTYFGAFAPDVLRELMRTIGITSLTAPIVAWVPPRRPYGSRGTDAQVAWLLPRHDGVEVRLRAPPPTIAPLVPLAIPPDGPLAIPPAIPVGARIAYAQHAEGLPCPYCTVGAHEHRIVRGTPALVCAACGRSFVPVPP